MITTRTMINPGPSLGVRAVGLLLAVLLLASGCGPSLHQLMQACLASKDAQSGECVEYRAKAQQAQAAALTARDMTPSTPVPGRLTPSTVQPRRTVP